MKTKKYDYDQVEMEVDGVRVPLEECLRNHYPVPVVESHLPFILLAFTVGFSIGWFMLLLVAM